MFVYIVYGILSHADANGGVEHMYESGSYLASRSLESGGSDVAITT